MTQDRQSFKSVNNLTLNISFCILFYVNTRGWRCGFDLKLCRFSNHLYTI